MKMWQALGITLSALSIVLVGCDQASNRADVAGRLSQAEGDMEKLTAEIEALKKSNDDLRKRILWQEFWKDSERVAFLTPADTGYSAVGFDLGVLTVKLIDVREYANGAKVRIEFGNTLSSAINGLKATIVWGKLSKNGQIVDEGKRTKEFTFADTLQGGKWTTVSVVLDGVPPSELGFVQISKISHNGISLSR